MKYRSKSNPKVEVDFIENRDGYVKFILNGIEITVAAKRFFDAYEMVKEDAK